MWGRIVLGTDGSPAATRAGETVSTIARAVSAKLTLAAYNKMSLDISEKLVDPADAAAAFLKKAKLD